MNFCACSNYFGWEGADCTAIGPHHFFLLAVYLGNVVLCVCGVALASINFRELRSNKKAHLIGHLGVIGLSIVGFCAGIASEVVQSIILLTPEKHNDSSNHITKTHEYRWASFVTSSYVFSITVLVLLNVPIMNVEAFLANVPAKAIRRVSQRLETIQLYTLLGDGIFIVTSAAVDLEDTPLLWACLQVPIFLLVFYLAFAVPRKLHLVKTKYLSIAGNRIVETVDRVVKIRNILLVQGCLAAVIGITLAVTFPSHRSYAPVVTPPIFLITFIRTLMFTGCLTVVFYSRLTVKQWEEDSESLATVQELV